MYRIRAHVMGKALPSPPTTYKPCDIAQLFVAQWQLHRGKRSWSYTWTAWDHVLESTFLTLASKLIEAYYAFGSRLGVATAMMQSGRITQHRTFGQSIINIDLRRFVYDNEALLIMFRSQRTLHPSWSTVHDKQIKYTCCLLHVPTAITSVC